MQQDLCYMNTLTLVIVVIAVHNCSSKKKKKRYTTTGPDLFVCDVLTDHLFQHFQDVDLFFFFFDDLSICEPD